MSTGALSSVVAALVLVLTSCGGGSDDDASDEPPADEIDPAPPETADAGPVADGSGGSETDTSGESGPALDPGALPTEPIDLASVASTPFTPALTCPLLSSDEAWFDPDDNLQTTSTGPTGCTLSPGNAVEGALRVELLDSADPSDPLLAPGTGDEVQTVPQDGPGTDAVALWYDDFGDQKFYAFTFTAEGVTVGIVAERLSGWNLDRLRSAADSVAANLAAALPLDTATAERVATGPGWCSVYDGAALGAALGTEIVGAYWLAWVDNEGCRWSGGFTAEAGVSVETQAGGGEPVGGLAFPANRDTFDENRVVLDVGGQYIAVFGSSPAAADALAANIAQRLAG